MARTKKLNLAKTVTTESPIFAGIATGSITGNAVTVTTNANLTGVVTSLGNATSFADDPTFTGQATINSLGGFDKISLNITNTSEYDSSGVVGVFLSIDAASGFICNGNNNQSFLANGTGGTGFTANIIDGVGVSVNANTQNSNATGLWISSSDLGALIHGEAKGLTLSSGLLGATIVSASGTGLEVSGSTLAALLTGTENGIVVEAFYNTGASINSAMALGASIGSGDGTGLEVFTAFGNLALDVSGPFTAATITGGRLGALIVGGTTTELTGFPPAHARFGDTAATSLSIKQADGNLYWRLGSSGTQTLTLARSATITGQQTATLPDYSGTIKVASTKTSTAAANATNNITYANVTGMSYAATDLVAGATYKLEFAGLVSHGAGFYQLRALLSSSKTFAIGNHINTANDLKTITEGPGTAILLGNVPTGTATSRPIYAMVIIRVNAATTLNIQFAQSVANATVSTLLVGAVSTLTRIS